MADTKDITSEAAEAPEEQLEAQVPGDSQETTELEPSTESQEVQEQDGPELDETKLEKLVKSNKALQARIYREAQSMKDKELHQERLRRESQEEERRLRDMSNAEYGSYLREQQSLEKASRAKVQEALTKVFTDAQDKALSTLDAEARKQVEAELNDYQSIGDFIEGVAKARADADARKMVASERKKLRESIRKELQAEVSEQFAPDIGRGTPASRSDNVHGIDAIAAGFAEKLAEAKKKSS